MSRFISEDDEADYDRQEAEYRAALRRAYGPRADEPEPDDELPFDAPALDEAGDVVNSDPEC